MINKTCFSLISLSSLLNTGFSIWLTSPSPMSRTKTQSASSWLRQGFVSSNRISWLQFKLWIKS